MLFRKRRSHREMVEQNHRDIKVIKDRQREMERRLRAVRMEMGIERGDREGI